MDTISPTVSTPPRSGNSTASWWTTIGSLVAAALAIGGIALALRELGGTGFPFAIAAAVPAIAASALIIARIVPRWASMMDLFALLLTWNAIGLTLAMLVMGIFSVGALMAFPLALLGIALASWPRRPGEPIATAATILSLGGGFAVPFVTYFGLGLLT